MIYITQLIYLNEGQEAVFDQFEAIAIPLIAKYNGQLLLRCRPGPESILEQTLETPYEIHLVCFDTPGDFQRFLQDEARKQWLHLKERSIRSVLLIQGNAV